MSNLTPNDPYLRLMFHLPLSCRDAIASCAVSTDKKQIRVMAIRNKGGVRPRPQDVGSRFFFDDADKFPSDALLGKILLYLQ